MSFEGSPIFGTLLGGAFLLAGIWMLIYDLVFLYRNNWDFSRQSKMEWGEEYQFDGRSRRLTGTKAKLFLIYPMWILIAGAVFFSAVIEL